MKVKAESGTIRAQIKIKSRNAVSSSARFSSLHMKPFSLCLTLCFHLLFGNRHWGNGKLHFSALRRQITTEDAVLKTVPDLR